MDVQLHGFSDASERAYGACMYIRSTDQYGNVQTSLVCSKSRVAPLKSISIPRLELCAALLLVRLYKAVLQSLRDIKFSRSMFWSDSTIVLHWVNTSPHSLKTFVGNRVAEIQESTDFEQWRHVPTQENPADLVSRGLSPPELLQDPLWLNGPAWLTREESNWPYLRLVPTDIPEQRASVVLSTRVVKSGLLEKYSSLTTLKRVIAYCLRFIHNIKASERVTGPLSTLELQNAENRVAKLVQAETFQDELHLLTNTLALTKGNKLIPLNAFLNEDGLIRVGGRIDNANIPYKARHQILMPSRHVITDLIIREAHVKHGHAGSQATLYATRHEYWIINGMRSVKRILRQCVKCHRAKPRFPAYTMGQLPKDRVRYKRPFLVTGVDYCGPFFIKERRHRNRSKLKVYVALFVCFATRAVHIELVSDLTTEAFIAALRRFVARRGKPSDIYSDNATNFVGANREAKEIKDLLQSQEHNDSVFKQLSNETIQWHFIPPRTPHFGGLWEASVKSFKYHVTRVIGNALLTYEVLMTYITELEGILNSRPLTPLSQDPNDLNALTPGHFLIGDSITAMPEHDLSDTPIARLSSWQHAQWMKQHFWRRWYKEYLHELTVRKGWHTTSGDQVKIGTLVTINEDNIPPMRWSIGRIIATHPGQDGVVRVVTVKTINGVYKRPVKRLSPLPLDDTD